MHVNEISGTDELLLGRLCDPADREAWVEFTSLYEPLVYRVARRLGLQHADAQNLVQEVIHKVGSRISETDFSRPENGFRRWLSTVARNAALDTIRRVKPDAGRGGSSVQLALREIPESRDLTSDVLFQRELERQAFRNAAKRIRAEFNDATWDAFWETMVNGRSCSDVAEQLGKTLGAVYTARCRVMQRLKEEVKNV
jgi:RNA polymerase sigma-70 factor, ECF subfamily